MIQQDCRAEYLYCEIDHTCEGFQAASLRTLSISAFLAVSSWVTTLRPLEYWIICPGPNMGIGTAFGEGGPNRGTGTIFGPGNRTFDRPDLPKRRSDGCSRRGRPDMGTDTMSDIPAGRGAQIWGQTGCPLYRSGTFNSQLLTG